MTDWSRAAAANGDGVAVVVVDDVGVVVVLVVDDDGGGGGTEEEEGSSPSDRWSTWTGPLLASLLIRTPFGVPPPSSICVAMAGKTTTRGSQLFVGWLVL